MPVMYILFSGLDMGTVYNFSVYVEDSAGYKQEVYTLSETTDDTPPTLANVCSSENNLASCITNYHNSYGSDVTNIYYHTSSLANSAADNSYRYAGANPNNYVCFGSDASTCPSDNLYRIIGVFGNETKLIKSTSYGKYAWDSGNSNTWNSSTKPDIRSTLNTTFLNTLSSTWQNKIETHAYKVGGMSRNDSATAKQYYNTEVGSSSSSTTDSMKIGLMYVSDYGFAASPDYWTTHLSSYSSALSNNWMWIEMYEWTISRSSDSSGNVFIVGNIGHVYNIGAAGGNYVGDYGYRVRPVFYLNSNVTYVSGTGTQSDPFRID